MTMASVLQGVFTVRQMGRERMEMFTAVMGWEIRQEKLSVGAGQAVFDSELWGGETKILTLPVKQLAR